MTQYTKVLYPCDKGLDKQVRPLGKSLQILKMLKEKIEGKENATNKD